MPTSTQLAGREYTMGDVMRLLGVSRAWIKTREDSGALPTPRRTRGGHRTYTAEDLQSIRDLAVAAGLRVPENSTMPSKGPKIVRRRIALINQKGGVGKTTITHNLGFALGSRGMRVLLVDLDRQYNLTTCCGVDIRDDKKRGLGYALQAAAEGEDPEPILRGCLTQTTNAHVDLLPNNLTMFRAESAMRSVEFEAQRPFYLQQALEPFAEEYDIVLIDCPPDLGILTNNGLVAAQSVIIPVDHHLAIQGLEQLQDAINFVNQRLRPLDILGVVLNRFDARTRSSQNIEEQIGTYYGDRLFATKISQTFKITEANSAGQSVLDYEPRNPVTAQFKTLADEVIERVRATVQGAFA